MLAQHLLYFFLYDSQDFPEYISQCVYSAFSFVFPTSGTRFGSEFRDAVYSVIFTWVSGVRPIPYNWRRWPFDLLDSAAMKKDMSDKKQAEEESKTKLRVGEGKKCERILLILLSV